MQCTSPGVPLAKEYVFLQHLLAKGQTYYFALHQDTLTRYTHSALKKRGI